MRASTAFFAGMGTVVVAIASGVSGGAWIAATMNPRPPRQAMETAHLHRQALPRRMSASGTVPYVAATSAFTDPSIDHGAANQRQTTADVVKKPASPSTETAASEGPPAKPADAPSSKPVTTAAPRTAARQPVSAPESAFATARDADLKRATESQKAPHRHWTVRHRYQPRTAQGQRRQQQSRQAGNGQGNSTRQARDDGGRISSGRTHGDQGYPGGRYRNESSPSYRAADRRHPDEPDPRYRQYDARPRYAERPAPFPFPLMRLFGPD
jgi:hypothetical protein